MHTDITYLQPSPYVLRVNASNPQDGRAPFSNYGQYTTDLFAPGTSILSVQPTGQESLSRYYPQADADSLYIKTDFSDAFLDVPSGKEVQIGDVSASTIGFDGDGSSLKAGISTKTGSYASVYVDVPVGNLSKYDVQDIRLAFNIGRNEARYCGLSIMLDDEEQTFMGSSWGAILDASDPGPNGWCIAGLHIINPDGFDGDFAHVVDSHGNTCIRLSIDFRPYDASYEPEVHMDTNIYIDQIAIGRKGNDGFLPYCYMNGTSMAAPVVTGCAAIVSSTLDAASPAERAAQTVRLLKGAVRQAEGYQGLCKQNGQVDLRLLGEGEVLVPVIESARVDGKTLVVEDENFTQGGTLLVVGKEVEANPWSEDKIVATLPECVASGLIPIVVRTSAGAEACRAFIVEVPKEVSVSVELYERDLEMFDFSDAGITPTTCPQSLVATDDGTLFAAAEDDDEQRKRANVHHLIRSDDQGVSWTYEGLELPMELKDVILAYGDGKVFIWGATPAMEYTSVKNWHLYSLDVSTSSFEHLHTYEAHGDEVLEKGAIVYVCGDLFFVDGYRDPDDWNGPYNLRIRRFDDQYGLTTEGKLLDHQYTTPDLPPKVAVKGNSIYVYCRGYMGGEETSFDRAMGLERIDVASDSSLSSTDLSAVFSGLKEPPPSDSTCIAVSDEGVFLIGSSLEGLLPDGAKRTDTFLLKNGATTFEPYPRRLSFAPFTNPVALCADGWLYAYGVSQYEDTPVFGRSTKVQEEKPDPVDPQPDDPDKDRPSSLPKTADSALASPAVISTLSFAGMVCIAGGLAARRES